jgi:hypothetical protein
MIGAYDIHRVLDCWIVFIDTAFNHLNFI